MYLVGVKLTFLLYLTVLLYIIKFAIIFTMCICVGLMGLMLLAYCYENIKGD